jgi:hypothetical protein
MPGTQRVGRHLVVLLCGIHLLRTEPRSTEPVLGSSRNRIKRSRWIVIYCCGPESTMMFWMHANLECISMARICDVLDICIYAQ